jgi:hypothetical protein
MANQFNTLTAADVTATSAVTPDQVRMVENVISLPFQGDVVARVDSADAPANRHTWLLRVVDVILSAPTRRPFAVWADISLQATQGHALARITVDGHTTSRQIRAGSEPRAFGTSLRLAIRRSTYPRDRLRVLVWVEASSPVAGGEAQAAVDAIDIQAR